MHGPLNVKFKKVFTSIILVLLITENLKRGANLKHFSVSRNPDRFMKTRELVQTLRGTTPSATHIEVEVRLTRPLFSQEEN